MKRMKFKLNKFKDKLINQAKKVKEEHLIKRYIKNNTLFIAYVIVCVLNATLLRLLCIHTLNNYFLHIENSLP